MILHTRLPLSLKFWLQLLVFVMYTKMFCMSENIYSSLLWFRFHHAAIALTSKQASLVLSYYEYFIPKKYWTSLCTFTLIFCQESKLIGFSCILLVGTGLAQATEVTIGMTWHFSERIVFIVTAKYSFFQFPFWTWFVGLMIRSVSSLWVPSLVHFY